MRIAAPALATAALLVALGLLPGCDRSAVTDAPPPARKQPAPAERGRQRAQRDVAAGSLRVYRYGNPASFANPRTDRESGLPTRTLLDCCVTAEAREETEAYNLVMREAAAARRRTPSAPSPAATPPAP